jgi:hypothetical protein
MQMYMFVTGYVFELYTNGPDQTSIFFWNACMVWVGFTLVVLVTSDDSGLLMEMVHDKCSTLITEFSTTLTTILPILFQYCYKYCYGDSRNLWTVMKAGVVFYLGLKRGMVFCFTKGTLRVKFTKKDT